MVGLAVSPVVGAEVDVVVMVVIPAVVVVDTPLVLDIESVPSAEALVVVAVVPVPESSPQATIVSPTSAAITTGGAAWTDRSEAEQNGQRLSLSQT